MLPEDTLSVVSKIKTDRAGAIAFSINGVLASSDVENLYGLFEAEAEGQDHISMIVIFKEYDGIDWESLFNEDTAKIRAEAFKKLKRYAIVGGPDWLNLAVEFFRPFGRVETKWFSLNNIDEGWKYIGARPAE